MQVTHLRSYLAQIGMTISDFAKKIECSRPYLSKLIAGDRYASPRLAKDILAATDGCIKMTTKKEAEKKRKEETQNQRVDKVAHMASTMMTHYEADDKQNQYEKLVKLKEQGAGDIPGYTSCDEHERD